MGKKQSNPGPPIGGSKPKPPPAPPRRRKMDSSSEDSVTVTFSMVNDELESEIEAYDDEEDLDSWVDDAKRSIRKLVSENAKDRD